MKPILFNTQMVHAILDGRKTQTRRIVKPQPQSYSFDGRVYVFNEGELPKPQYQPGDILYVRETWAENTIPHSGNYAGIEYRADYYGGREPILRWRPSIHMPREAARIFLRVTDVRVERLQHITRADAISEGCNAAIPVLEFQGIWDTTIKAAAINSNEKANIG